jgi:hypothetical protein
MNRLAFTVAVALFPAPMYFQECGGSFSTKQLVNLTEMARRAIESGAYTGWDEKAFVRAGGSRVGRVCTCSPTRQPR